ncbi:MAG: septum formation protein Maf [Ruminococcaceae bacterium]|nr:septum formation protein Maf [Oscillospiraceae bacterium]
MRYILASKSPRRREILGNIGLEFSVVTADTDESCSLTDPIALCEELALRKGLAVRELLQSKDELDPEDVIISADTVVECGGHILGKPADRQDAKTMLELLSGKRHRVLSGIALSVGGETYVSHSESFVCFEELSDADIERYLDSGEPYDKAGAYGIQGLASIYVKGIEGCYFGIVGLPINELDRLHRRALGRSLLG